MRQVSHFLKPCLCKKKCIFDHTFAFLSKKKTVKRQSRYFSFLLAAMAFCRATAFKYALRRASLRLASRSSPSTE